jgi:hypothetical protein
MKKLALIGARFFLLSPVVAGYIGFQLLSGKVPTPMHVQDRIATTNDLEQLRTVSLDMISDNKVLLQSTWMLTPSILLFTAVEFTIIALLMVFVFRGIRTMEVAVARLHQTSSGN